MDLDTGNKIRAETGVERSWVGRRCGACGAWRLSVLLAELSMWIWKGGLAPPELRGTEDSHQASEEPTKPWRGAIAGGF